MANDNKYIPALRFPEFQNDGEWGLASVGIYYKVQGGFAFKSGEFKDSGIPIVRISNIPNDGNYVDTNNCVYYDRIPNEKSFLIAKGDLLIAMSGATTGKTAVYNKDNEAYLNQRVGLFKSINSQNYYPFICQWVKTELFQNQLKCTLAAGAQPNISSKDIESFTLIYPTSDNSSNEQKKIADCLSSLDSYIDATKRKLEQLKEHKKGLMQRLFPAKGKTTPEFRFSEFLYDGEWDSCPVAKIFDRITRKNKGRSQNVLTISSRYGLVSQFEYFNKNVAAADLANYYLIEEGDFAYNKSRSQGYPYGVIRSLKSCKEGVVSPIYLCFRLKDYAKHNNDYFEYLFDSDVMSSEIGKVAQEGARNHGLLNIPTDNFFNIIFVVIPPSKEEQDKIALCLSSLDKLILAYEKSVSIMEQHKKALMHQLFPEF